MINYDYNPAYISNELRVNPEGEGCEWWMWNRIEDKEYLPPHHAFFRKMIPVDQDWHPSFAGNYVHVGIYICEPRSHKQTWQPYIRVTIWGGDDTGYEQEFAIDQLEAALEAYNGVDIGATYASLWDMGFRGA